MEVKKKKKGKSILYHFLCRFEDQRKNIRNVKTEKGRKVDGNAILSS